jgi:NADH-quinone oxidoreductase subunit L
MHADAQDIRVMGGLRKKLPVTFIAFLVGGASLSGIPFFSGFLSKEAIITAVWMNNTAFSWLMLSALLAVSFLTVLYTFRLMWFVFMGEERHPFSDRIIESPMVMRAPLVLLAALSLWFVVSWNPFDFIGWLVPPDEHVHASWITIVTVLWISSAGIWGYYLFRAAKFRHNRILENGFFIASFTQHFVTKYALKSASVTAAIDRTIDRVIHGSAYAQVTLAHITAWFDSFILDGIINGMAGLSRWIGSVTRSFQGGKIQVYIFWSVLSIIIFLIWTLN